MNDNNDSRTRSFDPVDLSEHKRSQAPSTKQKLIMSIFIVIILILLSFTVLVSCEIFANINGNTNNGGGNIRQNMIQVYKDSQDVHVGNLLLVNESFEYIYSSSEENIVDVYKFKNSSANDGATK